MVRVLLQLYLCYSYARNHDKIHVLLLTIARVVDDVLYLLTECFEPEFDEA